MKKNIYRKGAGDFLKAAILPVLFTIAVIGMIFYGLRETENSSRAEAVRILEDSIRRAVIMSYAVEGRYPESISYIEEVYKVHIDWSRYIVHYQIFASNLMPDILVIER